VYPTEPALSTPVIAMDDFSFDGQDILIQNATLRIDGRHSFKSVRVMNNGVLTHSPNGLEGKFFMELEVAGAIVVDATSRIDVSGKGYLGGMSGGNTSPYGRTLGNAPASQLNLGGSYGGYGYRSGNVNPMPVYGDFQDPNELGSGGSSYASGHVGGNGGGLVRLKADSLTLNGRILADGGYGTRDGSGGGVRIEVATLSGTGSVEAKGGASGMGGGGRIAVHYGANQGFDLTKLNAQGWSSSGAGTVFTKGASEANGDMRVDNRGYVAPSSSTPFAPTGTGEVWFDNLSVLGGAWMVTPDNLYLPPDGNLSVDSNAHLQSNNVTGP
jgi:hypothetical protein